MTPPHPFLMALYEGFGGVLSKGQHQPDSPEACPLEVAHVAVGDEWSDEPNRWPDLRPLNDAFSSDALRTQHMVPVMLAYWDWADWSPRRQLCVMAQLTLETVRQLVAELPGVPEAIRERCRQSTTLATAERAARAAVEAEEGRGWPAAETAWAVRAAAEGEEGRRWAAEPEIWVTQAAAWAACHIARAAARAAEVVDDGDTVLIRACQLWLAAAQIQESV
jgi:hypothetical protein